MDFRTLKEQFSQQTQVRVFFFGLSFLLLFSTSIFLSSIVEYYFLPIKENQIQGKVIQRVIGDSTRALNRYSNVIKNQLFYTLSEETKVSTEQAGQQKNLPTLDTIELTGVSIWPTIRFALILDKTSRKEKLFKVNDLVFDTQAELISIHFDHIILLQKDEEKIVYIQKKRFDLSQIKPSQTQVTKESKKDTKIQSNNQSAQTNKNNSPSESKTEYTFKRKEVDDVLNNLDTVLRKARAVPLIDKKGQTSGYIIRNIVPNSFFQKIGLKNEDIVIAVNGNKISNVQQAILLLDVLKNETVINIELIRDGAPLTLHYFIN